MTTPARSRRHSYKELSLQQLRSFADVCRLGGYAPAARARQLTGPAVWEQVKALERYFELELLERQGNGVQPTPDGRRLLEFIQPLLAGLDSAKEHLHQTRGELPRRLNIVTNLRVLTTEVSAAMARFRSRYPTVSLFVRYAGLEELQPLILDGAADVTLTLEPGPNDRVSPSLAYEPAAELDYLLVTPPDHVLVNSRRLRLEAITEHPLVLGERTTYSRHRVEEVFHRHNLIGAMNVAVETSSDEYTPACVRAGLGVGIAVGNAHSPLYHDLGVRPLRRWFAAARVGFLWRKGLNQLPLQRELADLLRSSLSRRSLRA